MKMIRYATLICHAWFIMMFFMSGLLLAGCAGPANSVRKFEDFSLTDRHGLHPFKTADDIVVAGKPYIVQSGQDDQCLKFKVYYPARPYLDTVFLYPAKGFDVYKIQFNRHMNDIGRYYYLTFNRGQLRRYLFMAKFGGEDRFLCVVSLLEANRLKSYQVKMNAYDTINFVERISILEDQLLRQSTDSSTYTLPGYQETLLHNGLLL
ncbi:hypothetical protein [Taibaiella chishuiensis]|uniref:Lipoprotein n=1 Tax=Taibaiella chishuiensis TaxID=1434707 RepID=A0A2P8CZH6_9BACT|nr:hypothetical protein [Taibaiella chishuiensis]PSK90371.1 hypothetical protein B0I18_108101 [Taibaiella chishuiensis]